MGHIILSVKFRDDKTNNSLHVIFQLNLLIYNEMLLTYIFNLNHEKYSIKTLYAERSFFFK